VGASLQGLFNTIVGPAQHNAVAMLRHGVMVKDQNNNGVLMCLNFVMLLVVLLCNIVNKEFLLYLDK